MGKGIDSESSWTLSRPQGWRLSRIKAIGKITLGKMLSSVESEKNSLYLPYVRAANLSERSSINPKDLKSMWFSPIEAKRLALRDNDILLVEGGATFGSPLLVKNIRDGERICFQNSINRIRTVEEPAFVYYWMKFLYDSGFHSNNVNTVSMPHLTKEKLADVPILLPPRMEQARIATWLDREMKFIDQGLSLIGKRRLLLHELKDSFRAEATLRSTKSVSDSKDGESRCHEANPKGWKTVRLGSLFREATDSGREGLPMLSVSIHSGISDKQIDDEEMDRKVVRSADKSLYKAVRKGDLVYNQMRAWQGAFGTAQLSGMVSPAYVVARPKTHVVTEFVEHLLRSPSFVEEMRRRSRGITDFRLRLYWDQFKNIQIVLPPINVQREIVGFLDEKIGNISEQISLLINLEELLREQRKALIRDAVTGILKL